jgi:hypothetical protein
MTDIPDDGAKILAVMPLHAITAVYGEQGLRARLAIEAGRLDDPAGQQKISEALELAGRLHAADRRQREPYLNHYADLGIMPTSAVKPLVAAA